jgi:HemY protein
MLRIIGVFVILLAAIYLGLWLHKDPGYVLIATHHWTIESTLWLMLVALAVAVTCLHCFLVLLKKMVNLPKQWQQWRNNRRLTKAQEKTKRGLIEFNEGHWRQANKYLIAAAPNANLPLINYLTAAQAAEALGNHTLRDQCLSQALVSNPEANLAIGLVQAQFQLDNHHWEQAFSTLHVLHQSAPEHPYVLKLLIRLFQQQDDWGALYELLPNIKSSQFMTTTAFKLFQQQVYGRYLQHLITTKQPQEIKTWVQTLPKALKYDPEIIYHYCKFLLSQEEDQLAEPLLRRCLQTHLDDTLLNLYPQLNRKTLHIAFIESLLEKNPDSAAVNLCMGRIYSAQKLWGTAKDYIEKSIHIQPCTEAYYELGHLFETLGNQTGAKHAYKQGLLDSVKVVAIKKVP